MLLLLIPYVMLVSRREFLVPGVAFAVAAAATTDTAVNADDADAVVPISSFVGVTDDVTTDDDDTAVIFVS